MLYCIHIPVSNDDVKFKLLDAIIALMHETIRVKSAKIRELHYHDTNKLNSGPKHPPHVNYYYLVDFPLLHAALDNYIEIYFKVTI